MSQQFAFAKLVVADLDAMAAFYSTVFGLEESARVNAAVGDRPITEVMFHPTSPGGSTLVLFHFDDTDTPTTQESILGFISEDVDALVETVCRHGGTVVDAAHDMSEHGVRVAFAADPEGHLLELVEVLGV